MLVLGSFSEGLTAFGSFTLDKYVQAYTDPAFLDVIANTFIFVLCSSVLATGSRCSSPISIPHRYPFQVPVQDPLDHPDDDPAPALLRELGAAAESLERHDEPVLKNVFSLESAPFNIYSLQGMILVEALLDLPIAYLIIAPAMASFDVALEESSRVFGAGTWRTLLRVTLPVLRPAILAAFVLGAGSQPGILCRAVGAWHAGTGVCSGHAPLRDDRAGFRHRLRQGRGGRNERAGDFGHPDLRLPGAHRGKRKIRDDLEPRLSARR